MTRANPQAEERCDASEASFEAFHDHARKAGMAALRRIYLSGRMPHLSACQLDDALDKAVTDALLTVYRKWSEYDAGKASRFTWFMLIAKQRFLRLLARVSKEAGRQLPYAIEEVALVAPVDEIDAMVERQAAGQVLGQVAPTQRQALVLRYARDMTLRDVARAMKTTVAAVQSLVQRGKERAAVCRSDEHEGDSHGRQAG